MLFNELLHHPPLHIPFHASPTPSPYTLMPHCCPSPLLSLPLSCCRSQGQGPAQLADRLWLLEPGATVFDGFEVPGGGLYMTAWPTCRQPECTDTHSLRQCPCVFFVVSSAPHLLLQRGLQNAVNMFLFLTDSKHRSPNLHAPKPACTETHACCVLVAAGWAAECGQHVPVPHRAAPGARGAACAPSPPGDATDRLPAPQQAWALLGWTCRVHGLVGGQLQDLAFSLSGIACCLVCCGSASALGALCKRRKECTRRRGSN
jgi:hypothetical protein